MVKIIQYIIHIDKIYRYASIPTGVDGKHCQQKSVPNPWTDNLRNVTKSDGS